MSSQENMAQPQQNQGYNYPGFEEQIQNSQHNQNFQQQQVYNPDIQQQIMMNQQQQNTNIQYPQLSQEQQQQQPQYGYSLGSNNQQEQVNMYNSAYNQQSFPIMVEPSQMPSGNEQYQAVPKSRKPTYTTCNYCGQNVYTKCEYRNGSSSLVIGLGLLLCGCWPCCLLPFCLKDCKDVHHKCTNCGSTVAKREFLDSFCE